MRVPARFRLASLLGAAIAATPALALDEMSEGELSGITGQDGITLDFTTANVTAGNIRMTVDASGTYSPSHTAYMDLDDVTLTGVGNNGATPGINTSVTATMDVDGDRLALATSWSRTRMQVGALRHSAIPGNSMGSIAFDSVGSFNMFGSRGLFDNAGSDARARLVLSDAELYYRQGTRELVLDDLTADIGYDAGTWGISNVDGLRIVAPRFDWNIEWEFGYRGNAATAYTTASNFNPMIRYGWRGGFTNFEASVRGGGVWVGGNLNNRTHGINLSYSMDYDTDFIWVIGDVGVNAPTVLFQNWVKMPGAAKIISVPNVTIDVLKEAGQGPGGFDYMGTTYDLAPPDAGGLALIARDIKFLGYNSEVRLLDPTNPVVTERDTTMGWALVYTLGDVDANVYLYPGGRSSSEGIRIDAQLGVQSPGNNWAQHTHFMIGDTDADVGVGFINSNFLIDINNAYLELTAGGIRLESTDGVGWRLNGQFGGGYLSDLSNPVRGFDLDLYLHVSNIDLRFTPPPLGQSYIGFEWDFTFNKPGDGNISTPAEVQDDLVTADSYIALAEPSQPDVRFTLGQISGDLDVRNGRIDLRSGNETASIDGTEPADNMTRLAFAQDLRFGLTAGTNPVIFNEVSIGTNRIGAIAIPGGNWYGELALKKQAP